MNPTIDLNDHCRLAAIYLERGSQPRPEWCQIGAEGLLVSSPVHTEFPEFALSFVERIVADHEKRLREVMPAGRWWFQHGVRPWGDDFLSTNEATCLRLFSRAFCLPDKP